MGDLLNSGGVGGLNFGGSSSKGSSNTTGSGTTASDITRMDDRSKQQLDDLVAELATRVRDPNSQFSKQAAISDVAGVVGNLYRQYSEQTLPQIFSAQAATGGYNSTSAQFLANDAFAETTARSAEVVLDTIGNYEKLAQGRTGLNLEGLLNALQLEAQAVERQKSTEAFTSYSTTKSKSKGFGLNLG